MNSSPHPIINREDWSFLTDITSVQVAGVIARCIRCCVKAWDALKHGQHYGFVRFGSRVDVHLLLDVSVKFSIGDKVPATTTILAMLPQKG
jgi:phosphatidylserine decarboxylase